MQSDNMSKDKKTTLHYYLLEIVAKYLTFYHRSAQLELTYGQVTMCGHKYVNKTTSSGGDNKITDISNKLVLYKLKQNSYRQRHEMGALRDSFI